MASRNTSLCYLRQPNLNVKWHKYRHYSSTTAALKYGVTLLVPASFTKVAVDDCVIEYLFRADLVHRALLCPITLCRVER